MNNISQDTIADLSKNIMLNKVENVFVGYTTKDGNIVSMYDAKGGNVFEMVGNMESLKFRLMKNNIQGLEDEE